MEKMSWEHYNNILQALKIKWWLNFHDPGEYFLSCVYEYKLLDYSLTGGKRDHELNLDSEPVQPGLQQLRCLSLVLSYLHVDKETSKANTLTLPRIDVRN